jgi:hypothetical protein
MTIDYAALYGALQERLGHRPSVEELTSCYPKEYPRFRLVDGRQHVLTWTMEGVPVYHGKI